MTKVELDAVLFEIESRSTRQLLVNLSNKMPDLPVPSTIDPVVSWNEGWFLMEKDYIEDCVYRVLVHGVYIRVSEDEFIELLRVKNDVAHS